MPDLSEDVAYWRECAMEARAAYETCDQERLEAIKAHDELVERVKRAEHENKLLRAATSLSQADSVPTASRQTAAGATPEDSGVQDPHHLVEPPLAGGVSPEEHALVSARLDKAEAACAAMRKALEALHTESPNLVDRCLISKALSSDAGKGWLSPEEAQRLRDGAEEIAAASLAVKHRAEEELDEERGERIEVEEEAKKLRAENESLCGRLRALKEVKLAGWLAPEPALALAQCAQYFVRSAETYERTGHWPIMASLERAFRDVLAHPDVVALLKKKGE